MTDGDRAVGESDDEDAGDDTAADEDEGAAGEAGSGAEGGTILPGELRKRALDELAKSNGALDVLSTIISRYSLESELVEAGNSAILRAAYVSLHKRSGRKWDKAVALDGDARAMAINGIFKNTRKGDFAQELADLIEQIDQNNHTFVVPPYIEETIREVVA